MTHVVLDSPEPPLIPLARQALSTLRRVTWLTKKLWAPRAYQALTWSLTGVLLIALNPAVNVQAMNASGATFDTPALSDFSFTSYQDITPGDVEATLQEAGFVTKPIISATVMGKPEKDQIDRKHQQQKQADAAAKAALEVKRKQIAQARPAQTGSTTAVAAAVTSSASNTYSFGYCTWWAKSKRPDLPNQLGNGGRWLSSAQSMGLATGRTPKAGSVVVTNEGSVGHVGYVESVDGDQMTVSDMNMIGRGKISKRTMSAKAGVIKGFIY